MKTFEELTLEEKIDLLYRQSYDPEEFKTRVCQFIRSLEIEQAVPSHKTSGKT